MTKERNHGGGGHPNSKPPHPAGDREHIESDSGKRDKTHPMEYLKPPRPPGQKK